MEDVQKVLMRTTKALNESNLDYVIVGGIAVILKGRMRTTLDVDLIVKNDLIAFRTFLKILQKYDFDVDEEQAEYAINEGFNFTVFDNKSPLRLDIKLAKQLDDIDVLKQAEVHHYHNIQLKIAPVNWILYSKISYIGSINDLSEDQVLKLSDVLDFISIWEENKDTIDRKWLKHKCESRNLGGTLKKILLIIQKIDTEKINI